MFFSQAEKVAHYADSDTGSIQSVRKRVTKTIREAGHFAIVAKAWNQIFPDNLLVMAWGGLEPKISAEENNLFFQIMSEHCAVYLWKDLKHLDNRSNSASTWGALFLSLPPSSQLKFGVCGAKLELFYGTREDFIADGCRFLDGVQYPTGPDDLVGYPAITMIYKWIVYDLKNPPPGETIDHRVARLRAVVFLRAYSMLRSFRDPRTVKSLQDACGHWVQIFQVLRMIAKTGEEHDAFIVALMADPMNLLAGFDDEIE
jgi:hypothetical protein